MQKALDKDHALELVKSQLQTAIELEHSTIPPYLYAFWTIKDHNTSVAHAIYDVVKEEMLHMGLACNMLNALGGSPDVLKDEFIPRYPTALPAHDNTHDPFIVDLGKCDVRSIVTFMHIELPRELGIEDDTDPLPDTIGEFYCEIMNNMHMLDDAHFQHGQQVDREYAPFAQGNMMPVRSKEDAFKAIKEIIEQGEGLSVTQHKFTSDPSHYDRFVDIYQGMGGFGKVEPGHFDAEKLISEIDNKRHEEFLKGIRNVVNNPRKNNAKTPAVRDANMKFNSAYSRLLDFLHVAFTEPTPDPTEGIEAMFNLTRPAFELMSIPVDADDRSKGYCGPTFEYIPPGERN